MTELRSLPLLFEKYFEPDNFNEVSRKYFRELRLSGSLHADPSGWIDTYSAAAAHLPTVLESKNDFGRYYLDVAHTIKNYKDTVVNLLSQWEGRPYLAEEVTLCPSVSAASLIVLATLKSMGVSSFLLETPCYFATAEQAEHLQLSCSFIPTYLQNEFKMPMAAELLSQHDHVVLWITQPRASLGLDQDVASLRNLLSLLKQHSYLVIDEATDQTFPSLLGSLRDHPNSSRLIKLKNFTKPMGLNGLRVAAILHDPSIRGRIADHIEVFGGSIDLYSLKMISSLAQDPERFRLMFEAVNKQVVDLRVEAQKLCRGTNVKVMPLGNGYIGALAIPVAKQVHEFKSGRESFLAYCRDRATPVIAGPSMYFASDPPLEFIRLNYLSHPQHILRAMEVFTDFSVH